MVSYLLNVIKWWDYRYKKGWENHCFKVNGNVHNSCTSKQPQIVISISKPILQTFCHCLLVPIIPMFLERYHDCGPSIFPQIVSTNADQSHFLNNLNATNTHLLNPYKCPNCVWMQRPLCLLSHLRIKEQRFKNKQKTPFCVLDTVSSPIYKN